MNTITTPDTTSSLSTAGQKVLEAAKSDPTRDINSLMSQEINPMTVVGYLEASIIRHYLRDLIS